MPGARFAELPVTAIRPNTWQPRTVFDEGDLDELVESIREIGVLQPIVVRPDKEHPGEYELIMGERRWRATQAAELETIPAIVRDTDDGDMLRDALLENLHRSDLNPLEEAAAYRQLLDDFGCTHEELANRIARSRPQISNTLRLLRLPPLVQRRVAAGVLSAGHARALLGLSDGAEIERLAQRIVSEGLSVRATEEIVMLTESDGGERQDTQGTASRHPQRGGGRAGHPAFRPVRDPGQGGARQDQGPHDRRVRLGRGSQPHPQCHGARGARPAQASVQRLTSAGANASTHGSGPAPPTREDAGPEPSCMSAQRATVREPARCR